MRIALRHGKYSTRVCIQKQGAYIFVIFNCIFSIKLIYFVFWARLLLSYLRKRKSVNSHAQIIQEIRQVLRLTQLRKKINRTKRNNLSRLHKICTCKRGASSSLSNLNRHQIERNYSIFISNIYGIFVLCWVIAH